MPLALCCMSHSPLLEITRQRAELEADIDSAIGSARRFVADFGPDVVVVFVPDHYNGFFHRLMPQFCIGTRARTVGDYDSAAGALDVPEQLAADLARGVLDAGVDIAFSRRMELDHATAQPLTALFGALDARPVVPVFVNAAAEPRSPLRRSRALGAAIGGFFADRPEKVLVLGSGGLSHDPPMPTLETAPPPILERIVEGRPLTQAEAEGKHAGAIAEGARLAAGTSERMPLSPDWDRAFLDLLAGPGLDELDQWTDEDIGRHGCGAHEIRTWVAAHAALAEHGPYEVIDRYYRPVPEYIAGFAVTTARPREAARSGGAARPSGSAPSREEESV
ncbi:3-carboxyethylcatechol 2,3-dioxygenase [Actinomadura barringtoniae]|uniref:3-carboxyethylcatechol 2,3-dioxygenase n=1 Tax=Actinomadura barringtoniae TaxID=1427535 RepID=A0A939PIS0_9ACTN|nr:3-carboxyethylcatechol 2,3-dioxygenase [Actinomadura barringtoniae]MBO2453185.1 3-carboxyethylcatechol 2,3-dioxygenase [Actinomadura barringtoniae]